MVAHVYRGVHPLSRFVTTGSGTMCDTHLSDLVPDPKSVGTGKMVICGADVTLCIDMQGRPSQNGRPLRARGSGSDAPAGKAGGA